MLSANDYLVCKYTENIYEELKKTATKKNIIYIRNEFINVLLLRNASWN